MQPYRIVNDVMRRMQTPEGRSTWIVLVWWLLWIGSNYASIVSLGMSNAETLEELREYFTSSVIVDLIDVILMILTIIIVLRTQRGAEARAVQVASAAASTIPPCPGCGTLREQGEQHCKLCGLDLWAAYDQAVAEGIADKKAAEQQEPFGG